MVSMAHRAGGEHTSAMLDWVEPKGKAALVPAILSILSHIKPIAIKEALLVRK